MNPFHLTDYKYLFFDIFYKNNKLYLIAPLYSEPFDSDKIIIHIGGKVLAISDKKIKNCGEPIAIYIYNVDSLENTINIEVSFYNLKRSYTLQHLANTNTNTNTNESLVLTTLFKDDFRLFPIFYDYYMKQGVTHFYMYYNGISTPHIKQLLNKRNVTLIDWPFQYFNNKNCKYLHHAQPGQLHHALYKYGKGRHDYMVFCDLDEYLYIPNVSLKEYILQHKEIDSFGFLNKWSQSLEHTRPFSSRVLNILNESTLNNKVPLTTFPKRFLTAKGVMPYNSRSKNIHKTSSVDTLGIHMAHAYINSIKEPKLLIHNIMFHFYNWSKPKRENKDCPMQVITLHF